MTHAGEAKAKDKRPASVHMHEKDKSGFLPWLHGASMGNVWIVFHTWVSAFRNGQGSKPHGQVASCHPRKLISLPQDNDVAVCDGLVPP